MAHEMYEDAEEQQDLDRDQDQDSKDLHKVAMDRHSNAMKAFQRIIEDYNTDTSMVVRDQWNKDVRQSRIDSGSPVMQFPRLHLIVKQISNSAKRQRPQPQVIPIGNGANPEIAEILEGMVRQIYQQYNGDIASDIALENAAMGGFGYIGLSTKYVNDKSFDQDICINRISDPTAILDDPDAMNSDGSDRRYLFEDKWMKREEFKRMFPGFEPMQAEADGPRGQRDWVTEDDVRICKYWYIDVAERELVQLADGTIGFMDEFQVPEGFDIESMIVNRRTVEEKTVRWCMLDGTQKLQEGVWPGSSIPYVRVVAWDTIVNGERRFISAIRFAIDAQKLLNAYKSGIAESLSLQAKAPWIGVKGAFKDPKWLSSNIKKHPYLEYEPVSINGQLAPQPTRNTFEAPIQSLSLGALQEADDIKASSGYMDNLVQPSSNAQLSGVAVERRSAQADLANSHLQDNLVMAQQTLCSMMIDLIPKVYTSPRVIQILNIENRQRMVAITQAVEGMFPQVQGHEGEKHYPINVGQYSVAISTGPSYKNKMQEERDVFMQIAQTNPAIWGYAGDIIFRLLGYPDLEQRAKAVLPPQVQQVIAADAQGAKIPPEVLMQMQALQAQNKMLGDGLQKLLLERQANLLKIQSDLEKVRLQTAAKIAVAGINNDHSAAQTMFEKELEVTQGLQDMLAQVDQGAPPASPEMPNQGGM